MLKRVTVTAAVCALVWGGTAQAECPVLPNQITNGQPADATKIMADLDHLRDCMNDGQVVIGPQPNIAISAPSGAVTTVKSTAPVSFDLSLPVDSGAAGQTLTSAGPGQPMVWQSPSAAVKPPLVDGYPVARPVPSTFSWTNQGPSLIVDRPNGPVSISYPGVGTPQFRGIYQAPPVATPYTLTVKMDSLSVVQSTNVAGLYVMDSAGKMTLFGMVNGNLQVSRETSPTTAISSFYTQTSPDRPRWLRIQNDGTKWLYSVSANGADWVLFYSENLTNYLGATISGIGVGGMATSAQGIGNALSLWSWELKAGNGTDSSWQ